MFVQEVQEIVNTDDIFREPVRVLDSDDGRLCHLSLLRQHEQALRQLTGQFDRHDREVRSRVQLDIWQRKYDRADRTRKERSIRKAEAV